MFFRFLFFVVGCLLLVVCVCCFVAVLVNVLGCWSLFVCLLVVVACLVGNVWYSLCVIGLIVVL